VEQVLLWMERMGRSPDVERVCGEEERHRRALRVEVPGPNASVVQTSSTRCGPQLAYVEINSMYRN
jgi:hypothetical protein